MSLARKPNLKDGTKLHVLGKPRDVGLGDVPTTAPADAEGALAFVKAFGRVDETRAEGLRPRATCCAAFAAGPGQHPQR